MLSENPPFWGKTNKIDSISQLCEVTIKANKARVYTVTSFNILGDQNCLKRVEGNE